MKVPTVLQVLPRLEFGGVERGTVEITAALAAEGWKAVVASAGGTMTKDVERAGGIHVTAPLCSKNPWTMRRNVALIERIIRHYGIDIVHARSRAPAWSARAAARRQGISFVTTFHGLYSGGYPLKKPYNSVMASGDVVIAISEFTRRHVSEIYGVPANRLRTIPRGVDVDIFDPNAVSQERIIQLAREWCLPDDAYVIMSPGRPSRRKGYSVLVEAARQLDHPNYRVLLVGADHGSLHYRKKLRAQIRRNGLEGIVRLTAPCRDMAAAYMLADAVVFAPVEPEPFGRVSVEAQAMGRPVIVTDLGGLRETVIDGESGWLVPAREPAALARALREALAMTPEERVANAQRMRDHITKNFTKALMCDRTMSVYRELLYA